MTLLRTFAARAAAATAALALSLTLIGQTVEIPAAGTATTSTVEMA